MTTTITWPVNAVVLASYLQGLATNEARPGTERTALSDAADLLNELARQRGGDDELRRLLTKSIEVIERLADDLGLDFEDIDDSIRLVAQMRRALGLEQS